MEDYKKKYEDALERAKVINPGTADYEVAVNIFPELKENKDERVRKTLIEFVKEYGDKFYGQIAKMSAIAWLEKQDEQANPYSGVSIEYNGHTWGMCARDGGVDICLDKQLFTHLEKQKEQKPAEWSENDELNFNQAIYVCHQYQYVGVEIWLKSLKQRMEGE